MKKLFEECPLTLEVVADFFLKELLSSIKDSNNVPEEFKDLLKEKGVIETQLQTIVSTSPRLYFDVFDHHKVLITIIPLQEVDNVRFMVKIGDNPPGKLFNTRKEADSDAISQAFYILEDKLKKITDEQTTV
jgi:hypothetical protein